MTAKTEIEELRYGDMPKEEEMHVFDECFIVKGAVRSE